MSRQVWVIQAIIILIFYSSGYAGEMFSASVRKVIDGDSLVVATKKENIEVRLYGVDSPEYDQPFSREAKKFVKQRVLGKEVMVKPAYRDSYGRLVAVILPGEKTLNEDLVRAGLAWVHPRYCKKSFCDSWKKSEYLAHKEKRGLWRDERPDPPWLWKRTKRKSR